MTLEEILACFAFALGACIASFLNVVIWRVPRGESIVSPPSHCPKCDAAIKWWQNIPILSWLALRGKCANCRAPISPRYIFVELLGGVLFLAVFLKVFVWDVPAQYEWVLNTPGWCLFALVVWWIWVSFMIIGSFIDFDHQLLPDFVTIGGMILGVVFWAVNGFKFGIVELKLVCSARGYMYLPFFESLLGLALGFGLLWLVRWLGSKAFRREAMGMGDVFLMGAVGALFGPVAVIVTLILSSVFGSVVGVGLILLSKTRLGRFTAIPYGPYICMGCLAWMFWGPELVNWYLSLLGVKWP